jgi:hypothetical protein
METPRFIGFRAVGDRVERCVPVELGGTGCWEPCDATSDERHLLVWLEKLAVARALLDLLERGNEQERV